MSNFCEYLNKSLRREMKCATFLCFTKKWRATLFWTGKYWQPVCIRVACASKMNTFNYPAVKVALAQKPPFPLLCQHQCQTKLTVVAFVSVNFNLCIQFIAISFLQLLQSFCEWMKLSLVSFFFQLELRQVLSLIACKDSRLQVSLLVCGSHSCQWPRCLNGPWECWP